MHDNPFEAISPERLAGIYRWPDQALRFLAGEADCLHVLGASGMGKTTCLQQVRLRLHDQGTPTACYCVPASGLDDPRSITLRAVTMVDEVDRLTAQQLGELLNRTRTRKARLVLGAHRRLVRAVRRAGLTCMHVALRPMSSPVAAARLLEERVALAVGHGDHGFRLDDVAARTLLRLSRGNIERCLQIGYELVEDNGCEGPVTAAQVVAAAASLRRALDPPAVSR